MLSAVHQHLSLIGIMATFSNFFNELFIVHPKSIYRKSDNSTIE